MCGTSFCPWSAAFWVAVLLAVFSSLFGAGCGVEGLHDANPKTIVQVNPASKSVYFYDNKDNDVTIESLVFDKDGGGAEIKNLKIINNSSNVRTANVGQLDAMGREAVMVGQGWKLGMEGAASFIGQVMPAIFGAYRQQGGVIVPPGATSTQPVFDPAGVKSQLDAKGATEDERCAIEVILGLPTGTLCK